MKSIRRNLVDHSASKKAVTTIILRSNLMPNDPTNTLEMTSGFQAGFWFKAIAWTAQIIVALILAQTLFFKFTYAPETQVIFGDRGGRPVATAVGVFELICVVLLLLPSTASVGALLSLAVISGAIFTHLTSLGIQIREPGTGETDGGLLFTLALIVAAGSIVVMAFRWRELPWLRPSRARSVLAE
jgi:hypothetical protein